MSNPYPVDVVVLGKSTSHVKWYNGDSNVFGRFAMYVRQFQPWMIFLLPG